LTKVISGQLSQDEAEDEEQQADDQHRAEMGAIGRRCRQRGCHGWFSPESPCRTGRVTGTDRNVSLIAEKCNVVNPPPGPSHDA
jgi:hypothetical protein